VFSETRYWKTRAQKIDFVPGVGGGRLPCKLPKIFTVPWPLPWPLSTEFFERRKKNKKMEKKKIRKNIQQRRAKSVRERPKYITPL
jgi:hypothetical protein